MCVLVLTRNCPPLQVFFFNLTAQRQAMRMRKLYFEALMRQDLSWYDGLDSAELTSRVSGYGLSVGSVWRIVLVHVSLYACRGVWVFCLLCWRRVRVDASLYV